ncbi:SDR family oxidoreductase [Halalkalicoccus jeotgali]|uniref:Short-chain dehydrogenase/reductase SDR n=1 Tax=Halalkalicoccus jeotgali (strain DSM 18796 / CECT 7217 / JCM 14584 / KCTC 4019 / B3) TaxID=795797 RepID=D8JCW2_HALJB|nr:SDR family oxidoreductase [Halalkalicoccus jeotgali]ADJ16857.1 short-chain dehydrogenase/reductase SDR [Halalkalicoccus jeotgali B3]ELY38707.1 short-chain dehydrogenase/reductase SDR [Halalkalicoccus jeotgali B3]
MQLDLEGNAALVIASSSGLGKASAASLAKAGVDVIVNGRDEGRLENAVEELRETAEGQVIGCVGDMTNPDDITRLVETTVDEFGRLDHLVTSAGGPTRYTFTETQDDDWYYAYDMLVMSVVRAVRESIPHLREVGGTITNITSMVTKEASGANVLSSSVRMCVQGLAKVLSDELAPEIRVNTILPGLYYTPRRHDAGEAGVDLSDVPLDRMGEARELGDVVAFLCSGYSSYLTGAAIPIDGGALQSTL